MESKPDVFGMINKIEYTETDLQDLLTRRGTRMYAVQRSIATQNRVDERKSWKRYGQAAGTEGIERGVTMMGQDNVYILDPYSHEAQQTGGDKLIEKFTKTLKKAGDRVSAAKA